MAATVLAWVLFAAGLAEAATTATVVARVGSAIVASASDGVTNDISLAVDAGELVVTEAAADLVAGDGCRNDGTGRARCGLDGVTVVEVNLGDRNDRAGKATAVPVAVHYDGGADHDTFVAANDADGPDRYSGSGGSDAVSYAPRGSGVTVTIDGVADDGATGTPEGDNVLGDVETILGSASNDVIIGSEASNTIAAGRGDDVVEGRGGNDSLLEHFGNDVYVGGHGDDWLTSTVAADGADSFAGGVGMDTMSYGPRGTAGVTVTLDDVADDGETGAGEGDNVHSDVEVLVGTAVDDRLVGSDAPNRILGAAGADVILGAGGDDREEGGDGDDLFDQGAEPNGADAIIGGAGSDTVAYDARIGPVAADSDGVADDGEAGEGDNVDVEIVRLPASGDLCPGLEHLAGNHIVGTDGADDLRGSDGADVICGLGGSDRIIPGPGDDIVHGGDGDDILLADASRDGSDDYSGGAGHDWINYAERTAGLVLAFTGEGISGEVGEGDTLRGDLEHVTGGDGADTIAGAALNQLLDGRGGNDAILPGFFDDQVIGGSGDDRVITFPDDGSDRIAGGSGVDVVLYANRSAGVRVSLDDIPNDGEPGEADDVASDVENLIGGRGDDVLVGNDQANALIGNRGDDLLEGRGGDDVFPASLHTDPEGRNSHDPDGADEYRGGDGRDTVTYAVRLTGISIFADDVANDGSPDEGDNVRSDVESLVGGRGNDVLSGPAGVANTFSGGPGSDSVTYAGRTIGVLVDLDNVADDGERREADDVRSDVENVIGGAGSDILTGSAVANLLVGLAGNDTFFALAGADGADTYSGGTGADGVSYANRTSAVTVSLDGIADDGGAGEADNVLSDVENIIGGAGDDTLTGNAAANVLNGLRGADALAGLPGADTFVADVDSSSPDRYSGGAGQDTLSYAGRSKPVVALIGDTIFVSGRDEVGADIEVLVGGSGADILGGDSDDGATHLIGGPGDDVLEAGGQPDGTDTFQGGSGADRITYALRTSGVLVDLDGLADDGARGENDHVHADIEHITGGSGDDVLVGNAGDNRLQGRAGNDLLFGLLGNDRLDGAAGNDRLRGGHGDDTVLGNTGHDLLVAEAVEDGADEFDGGDGSDTLDYGARTSTVIVGLDHLGSDGAPGEGDHAKLSVEILRGGAGNDLLTALADTRLDGTFDASGQVDNVILGGSGNDIMAGGAGNDLLLGEDGDDLLLAEPPVQIGLCGPGCPLVGTDGGDEFSGGAGVDTVTYGARTRPLTVSIDDEFDDGELGEHDNVATDVENVTGGSGNDALFGSAADNILRGGVGRDELTGGRGADVLSGGDGPDTARYTGRTAGVIVDIDGVADDGEPGEADNVMLDVENLLGGDGPDRLEGSAAGNTIGGGLGHDLVRGREGPDVLGGGLGDDVVEGGPGDDIFTVIAGDGADVYEGGPGRDDLSYGIHFLPVTITLDDRANDGGSNEHDNVLGDIEVIHGGSGDDRLIGNADDNVIDGGAGRDEVRGGAGEDILLGAEGDDLLLGQTGDDELFGNEGVDDLRGGSGIDHCDVGPHGGTTRGCESTR